jgi:hypothetical protein
MARPLPRRLSLPLPLVVLLLVALGLNLARGFDLARRRQADLQPRRAAGILRLVPGASEIQVVPGRNYLLAQLPPDISGRLVLQRILPERAVLRWLEPTAADGGWLVVPLAGLEAGLYGLRWAEADETAAPRDWDRPPEERAWLGRFRLED